MTRVELDDTGRRVAAEQRALRPAQHFDPLEVEDREALQDRVFEHHVVIDEADRLRRVEIEIGVAEAANVETREGAAERAFDVRLGTRPDRPRMSTPPADMTASSLSSLTVVTDKRNVLQIFASTALRGDDDFAKAWAFFGCSILRVSGRVRSNSVAGS